MMKKNILVLTSVYPASDLPKQDTPVVHYFAKEWRKLGHNVVVIHFPSNFPFVLRSIASLFESKISAKVGVTIRTYKVHECVYEMDGVVVKRIPLKKAYPHVRYSKKQVLTAFNKALCYLKEIDFVPDVVTSHWPTPQLELLTMFKLHFNVPTCYVTHSIGTDIIRAYSTQQIGKMLSNIDSIGFRSAYIKNEFLKRFQYQGNTFMCFSGIPNQYITDDVVARSFTNISRFTFVGNFIARKFPAQIIPAIYNAYKEEDFDISFIGSGHEEINIKAYIKAFNLSSKVHLLGRLVRDNVISQLKKHDVFIMISRGEAFGLVYLEAMAVGCITIAARKEGFDGIIEHGVNGFLCEAGNVDELTGLLKMIKELPREKLSEISTNAIKTARSFTESNVAINYLKEIMA